MLALPGLVDIDRTAGIEPGTITTPYGKATVEATPFYDPKKTRTHG